MSRHRVLEKHFALWPEPDFEAIDFLPFEVDPENRARG